MELVSRQKAGQARLELAVKEKGWNPQISSVFAPVFMIFRCPMRSSSNAWRGIHGVDSYLHGPRGQRQYW
jgi:hypothetical protein